MYLEQKKSTLTSWTPWTKDFFHGFTKLLSFQFLILSEKVYQKSSIHYSEYKVNLVDSMNEQRFVLRTVDAHPWPYTCSLLFNMTGYIYHFPPPPIQLLFVSVLHLSKYDWDLKSIIIIIIIIIIMSMFLERLSMWNMLNCAEQVQIQKYETHTNSRCPSNQAETSN